MVKIKKSKQTSYIYIDTVSSGISEEFEYIRDGDKFSINRKNTSILEISNLHFEKFLGEDDNGNDILFSNANELEDYLSEILIYINNSFFPKPIYSSLSKDKFSHNTNTRVVVSGSYFTRKTTLAVDGQLINNVNLIDGSNIEFDLITSNIDGVFDLIIDNESGQTIVKNLITVKLSDWLDLRLGGENFIIGEDIRFRSGMSVERDVNGMFFNGSSPWNSWVKIESMSWTRGEDRTLEWVFTAPTAHMMIGIGSDQTNETNGAQYSQAEVEAYFTSPTNFWGIYGNNGNIGSAGYNSNSANFTSDSVLKIKFEGDGSVGSLFSLYKLPSANISDWDDESDLLRQFSVGGTLNPSQVTIMPFIISRSDSAQRFLGLKLT